MDAAVIFLPLLGAVIAGLFGRQIGDKGAQAVSCGLMLASAALSVPVLAQVAFGGQPRTTELFTWIDSGAFEAS